MNCPNKYERNASNQRTQNDMFFVCKAVVMIDDVVRTVCVYFFYAPARFAQSFTEIRECWDGFVCKILYTHYAVCVI